MPVGERTLRCVGGPFDGLGCAVHGEQRMSLPTALRVPHSNDARSKNVPEPAGPVIDYDVRRLLARDGKWHDFLVLSAWTSMQATVWINRRVSAR
ncbi:hypothetical protein [Microvirga massiliensis]|uniref:hypothetical protein n=1 Tax=Microvirga massiliensis TaxID=1033741 RepID=UPI0011C7BBD5|nr:hypothetical protein [Microvirga massiliensis]